MKAFRNVESELLRLRRRLLLAAGGMLLAFLLLLGRWFWLQVIRHRKYSLLARDNSLAMMPATAARGLILDRNGIVLANNTAAYTLEITPAKTLGLEPTIEALRSVVTITPRDLRRFHTLLAQGHKFDATPLLEQLDDAAVARFVAQRWRFPGVEVRARLYRNYPLGSLACHAVGYIGRVNPSEKQALADSDDADNYIGTDHIGKSGIELAFERQLHGVTGFDQVEVNAAGRLLRKLGSIPSQPGSTLVLSLDARMQKLAEDLYGQRSGACIAIDPRNGEVLTFASLPTFDANLFVEGILQEDWDALSQDPRHPLLNRALHGVFPPGSTYKPYLALGALTQGLRTTSYTLQDPGYFMFGNHKFRDDAPHGHGSVDLHRSLVVSCDTYYFMLANDWGVDSMHDFTARFGFGQPTGIELLGEARGVLPSKAWKQAAYRNPAQQRWYAGETVSLGIGQGYNSFTPLQIASALTGMAMRGTRMQPRLVKMIENTQTHRFEPTSAKPAGDKVQLADAVWQAVHDGMRGVNSEPSGTAVSVFRDAPYTSCGKTGTAQVFSVAQNQSTRRAVSQDLRDHALFVTFAPAEDPQICVALVVEHGGFGAAAAAPIARKLIDYHLLGRYPSDAEIAAISGMHPRDVAFSYAGSHSGVPPVPGAAPAAAASAASAPRAPAQRPATKPWPAASPASGAATPTGAASVASVADSGSYRTPRCAPGPLFTRFGAAPDVVDPAAGVRL